MKAFQFAVFVVLSSAIQASEPAELVHWVVLATTPGPEVAEAVRSRADGALPERVYIQVEDDPAGRVYRVAAGPYLRRSLADQMLREARQAGFGDARIEQTTMASAPLPRALDPAGAGGLAEAPEPDVGEPDPSARFRPAPDDHQLHRLLRGRSGAPAPAP